ncbi:UNVERIFIED_CONTAM: ABC-type Fe3+-citrate transport system substrate-binding protein [Paenibacillus sp. PvR008]
MAGPVTVKHNRGEITLDRPAQRVVVLEWTFTEDMIALGVQPVGNAGYKQYVTPEAALDSSMTDELGSSIQSGLELA